MGQDNPPPYEKINVPELNTLAQNYAKQGYAWSDADWRKRFPFLSRGRQYSIANADLNLSGDVDPLLSSTLKRSGFGNVDLSGNAFQQSKKLGQPILAKEQRDRNYFQQLLSDPMNQPRGDLAGLSGKNIAEIRAVESGNKISYDWANFGTRINQANAQTAAANSLGRTLGSSLGSIGSTAAGALINSANSSNDPYLNSTYYTGGYNPAYQGPQYGQGWASYNLPTVDPDYGNANYIGLGDTDTSGIAGTSTGGGGI